MKKLVAAVATTGILFAGSAATVSAASHEVQNQDTLWGIANKYDTSVQHLMDVNELESNVIHPGQNITTDEVESSEVYTVEKGDTLYGISKQFDVTVEEIQSWNDLSGTLIHIGEELEVKGIDNAEAAEVTEAAPSQEEVQNETVEDTSAEPVAETNEATTENTSATDGETMSVTATAYTAECNGCTGVTSTGIDLNANPNKKVIAVDPNVIPLGSKVHVEGYGTAIAGDVGGAINGNRIDVHVPSTGEANSWGVRNVNVTILD